MKKHILIIDDEQSLLNSMVRDLRGLNDKYEIYTSINSEDTLELIANYTIDLLITDIFMPEKEGIEIIAEAHKKYPALKIIAMSGAGNVHGSSYLDIAIRLGASNFLNKPFTREELVTAIESAL